MTRTLVSIAGYDPTGGAGVLLDAAVFRALGFHGAAVVTAWTVQDTARVRDCAALGPRLVARQFAVLAADVRPAGLKVGMTGSRANLAAAARILEARPGLPRVVDPILRSSSGARLLDDRGAKDLVRLLRGRATVATPNLAEAAALSGRPVRGPADMRDAAAALFDRTGVPILVKGGHLRGDAIDLLYDGARAYLFGGRRYRRDVHGTGCILSSSLLAFLARGLALPAACDRAVAFTREAIRRAVRPGRGRYVYSPRG